MISVQADRDRALLIAIVPLALQLEKLCMIPMKRENNILREGMNSNS
ncbi:hypothetical protein QUB47_16540 [Microcoleus sp. AT9_B5]